MQAAVGIHVRTLFCTVVGIGSAADNYSLLLLFTNAAGGFLVHGRRLTAFVYSY